MKALQQRMEQSGGRTVSLVQNFRSQEPIITWVNRLFGQWMEDNRNENGGQGYIQADYEEMSASRYCDEAGPLHPQVWSLADVESRRRD